MTTMHTIEERGRIYKNQMSGIQDRLFEFGQKYGWEVLDRGRKPNAGIFGMIGFNHSSIQVTSVENDWGLLPNKIESGMLFSLWCGVSDTSRSKLGEISREVRFKDLSAELEGFLVDAAKYLQQYGAIE